MSGGAVIEAAERGHVELTQLLSKVSNHTPKIVSSVWNRYKTACGKSHNITVSNKMFKQCIKLYCMMAQLTTGLSKSVISDSYIVI